MAPYLVTLAALVISHRRRSRAGLPSAEIAAATPGGVTETQPDTR